ncbi:MAG: alpha/beta hydrolase [Bryobacteraceae bacterium]
MGHFGLTLQIFVIAIAAALVLLPLAGALYQMAGAAGDARRYPPPGERVDIGGRRLHIQLSGEGEPAVVLEAGIGATSLSWGLIQPEISKMARVASYDRAGLGWSERADTPREIGRVVEELRLLLQRAGVGTPRILVAHSYGGLVARRYAAKYPAEVAGMVLVDPVAASEWAPPSEMHSRMLQRGMVLSRRGALLARLGVVRGALRLLALGATRAPQWIARASGGRGAGFAQAMVGEIRKLPRESWPIVQAHWCDPKSFHGVADYLEALPESAAAVLREESLGDIPIAVLSAENAGEVQRAEHARLAALSSRGRMEIVTGSLHWIQLDRPDRVIAAIREMIADIKS